MCIKYSHTIQVIQLSKVYNFYFKCFIRFLHNLIEKKETYCSLTVQCDGCITVDLCLQQIYFGFCVKIYIIPVLFIIFTVFIITVSVLLIHLQLGLSVICHVKYPLHSYLQNPAQHPEMFRCDPLAPAQWLSSGMNQKLQTDKLRQVGDQTHFSFSLSRSSVEEDNIKMNFRDIGFEGLNWIHLDQGRNQWQFLVSHRSH